jgi:cytochrome P450
MTASSTIDVDTLSNADDPYPLFAELREKEPVKQLAPLGWWAVSRYEDVNFVFRHPELLENGRTNKIFWSTGVDERLRENSPINNKATTDFADPPAHTRMRKLLNVAFVPRAINRLEDRIRAVTSEFVDNILAKDEFDLLADLAAQLPMTVIAEVLGVDPSRRADFKRWNDASMVTTRGTMTDDDVERILQDRREYKAFFEDIIRERSANPREDLISDLCRAEVNGSRLTSEEVHGLSMVLQTAGGVTTTHMIGNAMHLLLDRPELLQALRADAKLIPQFLEESLRFEGPSKMMPRYSTRELQIGGVTIPAEQIVIALIGSANRDPAQFPDPDTFDIHREQKGHMSFGFGIHFCVGAPLARMEGRIAVEELLRRLPAFSRNGKAEWLPYLGMRGLKKLPLRFDHPRVQQGSDAGERGPKPLTASV